MIKHADQERGKNEHVKRKFKQHAAPPEPHRYFAIVGLFDWQIEL